jgi:hypothetical protein
MPASRKRGYVRTSRKPEPKWKLIERVAALLEQTLSPEARVAHDVQLPVLGMPGQFHQCDVVVRMGPGVRETTTIVEVQRRGRKVEINTFLGWLLKKDRVGAQHLICVSTVGFPDSVIAEAARHGPSVRLLTLKEIEQSKVPFDVFGTLVVNVFEGRNPRDVRIVRLDRDDASSPESLRGDERVFEIDGRMYHLMDIARREMQRSSIREPGTYEYPIDFGPVRCHHGGTGSLTIHLRFVIDVVVTRDRIPVVVSEYSQVGAGTVAWVATAREENGREYHLVFAPDETGRLVSQVTQIVGLESGEEVDFDLGAGKMKLRAISKVKAPG